MVLIDFNKVKKFKYFFEHSEKGFTVAEINAIPILNEFLAEFIEAELIDVSQQRDYHVLLSESKVNNVILYNFEKKFATPELLSEEINLNRDIFYSYNKNLIFVFTTDSINELIRSNVSFWSCVFFHEIFYNFKPTIFEFEMINETVIYPNSNLITNEFIDNQFQLFLDFDDNNIKSPSNLFKELNLSNLNLYIKFISLLFTYGKFKRVIEYCDIILDNIFIKNDISSFCRLVLFRAAAYYYLEKYEKSKFDYLYIIEHVQNNSMYYIIALNNLICVEYKIHPTISHFLNNYFEKIQENIDIRSSKIIGCFDDQPDYFAPDYVFLNNIVNYIIFLLMKSDFYKALEYINKTIENIKKADYSKYLKQVLIIRLLKAIIYIIIGKYSEANNMLKDIRNSSAFLHRHIVRNEIDILYDYCISYLYFSIGEYSKSENILKKYYRIFYVDKNMLINDMYCVNCNFLYILSLYFSGEKNQALYHCGTITALSSNEYFKSIIDRMLK